jgi:citrate synthase
VVSALPHDSHFMGILLAEISALSTCHPEQNPALAGQDVYKDKEIVDKQILRLIGGPTIQCNAGPGFEMPCPSARSQYVYQDVRW